MTYIFSLCNELGLPADGKVSVLSFTDKSSTNHRPFRNGGHSWLGNHVFHPFGGTLTKNLESGARDNPLLRRVPHALPSLFVKEESFTKVFIP